ncbi:TetR/AcrR family transcriptional regulator [Acetobacterium woodii]|uniref:Transcriptional regulator TetR family n=1 Tax=Acetobacterium woodii (strain ATCC 29683 / DSM 1030 / JCM 2381 / KCTC 1655 / WB1) TaxID=931626 RepID=H6LKU9_ACEWD|nr:TetR-like C-terminal domain-containing protein [Acetobacterium woodii]AFA50058.1 transcriptional regulator TetR family [Acetobacterium woodii DSM 1030]
MLEKSIQKITVRELSDFADINRGTFYLHYKDVFDLLDQIENKLIKDFSEVLNQYPSLLVRSNDHRLLVDVFAFIESNEDIMRVLLCKNSDPHFLDQLKNNVKTRYFDDWQQIYLTPAPIEIEYFFSYFLSGCIGLIIHWLSTGMTQSPEQIAKLTKSMILEGNNFLNTINNPVINH